MKYKILSLFFIAVSLMFGCAGTFEETPKQPEVAEAFEVKMPKPGIDGLHITIPKGWTYILNVNKRVAAWNIHMYIQEPGLSTHVFVASTDWDSTATDFATTSTASIFMNPSHKIVSIRGMWVNDDTPQRFVPSSLVEYIDTNAMHLQYVWQLNVANVKIKKGFMILCAGTLAEREQLKETCLQLINNVQLQGL